MALTDSVPDFLLTGLFIQAVVGSASLLAIGTLAAQLWWLRRRRRHDPGADTRPARQGSARRGSGVDWNSPGAAEAAYSHVPVSRAEIRDEFIRDPAAARFMLDDDTPTDVLRYLYLEAERRARMRKVKLLDDSENDLFAPPRRGPNGGSSGTAPWLADGVD